MVKYRQLAFLMVVCGFVTGACRTEQLHLYVAYKRGDLRTEKPRTDGFYYRLTPPCGFSDSTMTVIYFYRDGSSYHGNWRPESDLDRFEEKLRGYFRPEKNINHGMGWGVYQWRGDTLHIEQFNYATRGRLRAAIWKAVMHGDVLQKVFSQTSHYTQSGLAECVGPFHFRPSSWKPDSSRFFEQDRGFLRSQAYYEKQELRRTRRNKR